jgi:exonuclease SbcC
MLRSLELSNWKTHKKTKLVFKKGVNVMVGVMGAGKSSTMDAISFALFGTFPALNSKRITLANLISSRPVQQDDAEVRLVFDSEGQEYAVTRKISNSKNTARLEKNGAYLQTQPTKVTEEIESLLKIDYDTFARAVYAEQNGIDYFLELPKGDRKKQIDHMLGLDSFVSAEENSTALINTVKNSIKSEEDALSRIDVHRMKSQADALAIEIAKQNKEQSELSLKDVEQKKRLKQATAAYEEAKKLLETKKAIETEISSIESRISTLEIELSKMPGQKEGDLKAAAKELTAKESAVSKELLDLKNKEKKKRIEAAETEAEIKQTNTKAKEKAKLMSEFAGKSAESSKKELDAADAELKRLIESAATAKSEGAEAQKWRDELSKHIGNCPVCERALEPEMKEKLLKNKEDAVAVLKAKQKEIESEIGKKSALSKQLSEMHSNIVISRKKLADYDGIESMLERLVKAKEANDKELEEASSIIKEKEAEHQGLMKQNASMSAQLDAMERRSRYSEEIKKGKVLVAANQEKLKAITVDQKGLYAMQDGLSRQNALTAETSANLQAIDKHIATLSAQSAELAAQLLGVSGIEKRIGAKKSQITNLNKFKGALIDTEAFLRARLVGAINGLMEDLWHGIYPYGDYSSLRMSAEVDDYVLELNAPVAGALEDEWLAVDSIASGGERSIASLTLRIALAMVVVPNLKWLILDEPTHNIDANGISKIIEIFGNTLPSIVEQIFIITHDENMKQINSAKVYQFDRNKAENAPTVVSEV